MALFSDLDLARRLERAEGVSAMHFVEARAEVSPASNAAWIEAGGAYVLFDGAQSPVTQTFGLGLFEPCTNEVLDRIEGFFFERQASVNHEVSPLAGVEVFSLLADRGYRPIELTSVMYRSADASLPSNPAVETRIANPSEYEIWAKVSADGWCHEMPELRDFIADLGRVMARKRNSPAWLASIEGKPIAAASQTICDGVSHMAGACTVPEARCKGAQLALLSARLKYAAKQGCELASMGALPGSGSQRNAERNGFLIAYTRQKWQLPFA